ncbi:MAG: FHA domain-containing protein [Tepidisphaeraceae bacterium]
MGILFVDNGEVRTFDLNGTSTIGRDGTNDIIVKHPTVSRNHARIDEMDGRYFLTDFSSRNGTRINGRAVAMNEPLQNGSRIRIGHVRAWFYVKMPGKLPRSLSTRDSGIVFHCVCGQRLWSASDTSGMSVVCNACNQNVEVPARSDDDDEMSGTVQDARLAVQSADEATVCGICQWPIDPQEQTHVCSDCKTPSHQECWLENRGCSTYGCSQVNALAPKPTAEAAALPPVVDDGRASVTTVAKPAVAWGHMLLGLSVVAALVGLLAFGVPAALLALASLIRLITTRQKERGVLAASVLIAVIGAAAGVMISRFWWLDHPLF